MKLRKKMGFLALAIWASLIIYIMAIMSSWHNIDYSKADKKFALKYVEKSNNKSSNILLSHFLAGACQCSEYITNYLVSRGVMKDTIEKVVIFDDVKNFKQRLVEAGFEVEVLKIDDVEKYDFPSGIPQLLISDHKKLIYQGGYSNFQINPFTDFKDVKIVNEYINQRNENSREIASLPAIGCATAKKYKEMLDPFKLKYED